MGVASTKEEEEVTEAMEATNCLSIWSYDSLEDSYLLHFTKKVEVVAEGAEYDFHL